MFFAVFFHPRADKSELKKATDLVLQAALAAAASHMSPDAAWEVS